jgi:hypothetical protein
MAANLAGVSWSSWVRRSAVESTKRDRVATRAYPQEAVPRRTEYFQGAAWLVCATCERFPRKDPSFCLLLFVRQVHFTFCGRYAERDGATFATVESAPLHVLPVFLSSTNASNQLSALESVLPSLRISALIDIARTRQSHRRNKAPQV